MPDFIIALEGFAGINCFMAESMALDSGGGCEGGGGFFGLPPNPTVPGRLRSTGGGGAFGGAPVGGLGRAALLPDACAVAGAGATTRDGGGFGFGFGFGLGFGFPFGCPFGFPFGVPFPCGCGGGGGGARLFPIPLLAEFNFPLYAAGIRGGSETPAASREAAAGLGGTGGGGNGGADRLEVAAAASAGSEEASVFFLLSCLRASASASAASLTLFVDRAAPLPPGRLPVTFVPLLLDPASWEFTRVPLLKAANSSR